MLFVLLNKILNATSTRLEELKGAWRESLPRARRRGGWQAAAAAMGDSRPGSDRHIVILPRASSSVPTQELACGGHCRLTKISNSYRQRDPHN